MQFLIRPAVDCGRKYAFPTAWAAVFATGVALSEPLPSVDVAPYLSFAPIGKANAAAPEFSGFVAMNAEPASLSFLPPPANEPDDTYHRSFDGSMGHGRFAAPGNAIRRQVQLRPVSPRTADELAGFFRNVSFTLLTDIRQGEVVPAIKVDRVPADLGSKDGVERKQLFITAILPVVLEVNQRVLGDRDQLLALREKLARDPFAMSPIDRIWLDDLADRYETTPDQLDELVRRVDIVPPSMAIAQGGVESGWGTSAAARSNALFGQIQRGMPQPFSNVGEATEAYIANLNTHPAYAGFRAARALARQRGEEPDGYSLIGTLLRYSERGLGYVQFVRQIMRENELSDFDKARLPDPASFEAQAPASWPTSSVAADRRR
jgi:Bax protein